MAQNNKIVKNTTWLFIFNIAKILFPFITLPYLTRVLSTETYGVVTYVKTVMTYMQIFVDFGFVLSGTKDIVKALSKKKDNELGIVVGDTMISRIILGLVGFIITLILSLIIPILKENILYNILSYFVVFESIFLMDFLFRGFERMHVIAIRFIVMKILSSILTFILIKNDSNLLLIPILDIISSTIAVALVWSEYHKLNIRIKVSSLKNVIIKIKESFVYFLSNAASTSFNALGTIIIGIMLTKTQVAYWGICMQIIGTIQALYNPICDGIYPEMIRTKNISIIRKVLKIFIPLIIIGSIATYLLAPLGIKILGGTKYTLAVPILRMLIPCLIISFPAMIFGWPTVGAIGDPKDVTKSTIISIILNIIMLIFLIIINKFTLTNIAIVRVLTEMILFLTRYRYFRKYKTEFVEE